MVAVPDVMTPYTFTTILSVDSIDILDDRNADTDICILVFNRDDEELSEVKRSVSVPHDDLLYTSQ